MQLTMPAMDYCRKMGIPGQLRCFAPEGKPLACKPKNAPGNPQVEVPSAPKK